MIGRRAFSGSGHELWKVQEYRVSIWVAVCGAGGAGGSERRKREDGSEGKKKKTRKRVGIEIKYARIEGRRNGMSRNSIGSGQNSDH